MCKRPPKDHSLNTYMGISLGTTMMQAVILDSKMQVLHTACVTYDVDLPEFQTVQGVSLNCPTGEFLVNPVMYVKALDILINCLKGHGADLNTIVAIGGAAHRYSPVFWTDKGFRRLCGLNARLRLHEQLNDGCFKLIEVSHEMRRLFAMEQEVGGVKEMIRITGSKCYQQMPGAQIRKIYQEHSFIYHRIVRISLLSSFLGSLLVGNIASIDYSDGSFMSLLDIEKKVWSIECLSACAPVLKNRLMLPIAPNRLQGHIHNYFVTRWGFPTDCMIVCPTGSTPTTLAALRPDEDSVIMALWATDNIIIPSKKRPYVEQGHVLCHPTNPGEYMTLYTFRNGSNVRKAVRQELANDDLEVIDKMLDSTPMGNDGNLMVRFDVPEHLFGTQGTLRWNSTVDPLSDEAIEGVEQFNDPQTEVRAFYEGQMMQRRIFVANTNFRFGPTAKVIVVGANVVPQGVLQVISDVFNTPVYTPKFSGTETLVMGAAYRARYAFYEYREANCNCLKCRTRRARAPKLSYDEFFNQFPSDLELAAQPQPGCESIYPPLINRLRKMCHLMSQHQPSDQRCFMSFIKHAP